MRTTRERRTSARMFSILHDARPSGRHARCPGTVEVGSQLRLALTPGNGDRDVVSTARPPLGQACACCSSSRSSVRLPRPLLRSRKRRPAHPALPVLRTPGSGVAGLQSGPPRPGPSGPIPVSADGAAAASVDVAAPIGISNGSVIVASVSMVGADSVTNVPSGFSTIPGGAAQVGTGGGRPCISRSTGRSRRRPAELVRVAGLGCDQHVRADGRAPFWRHTRRPARRPIGRHDLTRHRRLVLGPDRDIGRRRGARLLGERLGPRPWADTGVLAGIVRKSPPAGLSSSTRKGSTGSRPTWVARSPWVTAAIR